MSRPNAQELYNQYGSVFQEELLKQLVNFGELTPLHGDYYEDLGGHVIHETNIDEHVAVLFSLLTSVEQEEILTVIREKLK